MNSVEIRAKREAWNDCMLLYFLDGGKPLSLEVTASEVEEGAYVEPSFRMDSVSAQKLFDDLYMQGLRPSEERNETSAYKEAKDHIADLKNVVSNLFEIIKKA